ncbi:hypothetical protein F2Q69_00029834 [Brassica cretica]|uniref:Uncharacterized protein n=1 Tax=Brassica cretica TaxID=69181 RepID=A0A8S9RWJ7_BRACR|nr:hypothetical protein F2Q69_00029834 [Brassica cretica]
MTNAPPANELRQKITAALTDQVQILRDLLVQLRTATRTPSQTLDVAAKAHAPTTENASRRRNSRNPERRNRVGGGSKDTLHRRRTLAECPDGHTATLVLPIPPMRKS